MAVPVEIDFDRGAPLEQPEQFDPLAAGIGLTWLAQRVAAEMEQGEPLVISANTAETAESSAISTSVGTLPEIEPQEGPTPSFLHPPQRTKADEADSGAHPLRRTSRSPKKQDSKL